MDGSTTPVVPGPFLSFLIETMEHRVDHGLIEYQKRSFGWGFSVLPPIKQYGFSEVSKRFEILDYHFIKIY